MDITDVLFSYHINLYVREGYYTQFENNYNLSTSGYAKEFKGKNAT